MRITNPSSGDNSILAAVIILFAASFISFPTQAGAPTRSDNDAQVTAEMFGCIYDLPKVRNTFLFHPDPEKLKEAIHIFSERVPDTEYPVGTVMQLVPFEAMVKHSSESCHAAGSKYDFVCEKNHGCLPLSIGDKEIAAFQAADPRCTPQHFKENIHGDS